MYNSYMTLKNDEWSVILQLGIFFAMLMHSSRHVKVQGAGMGMCGQSASLTFQQVCRVVLGNMQPAQHMTCGGVWVGQNLVSWLMW